MRFATKLGLGTASAALVIGPLLGAAVFFEARSVLRERIVHEQVQSARSVMREIDTALHRAYRDVSVIAADELLAGFMESTAGRHNYAMAADELDERADLTGPWDALAVFDTEGRAVLAPKPLGDEPEITAYAASEPAFRQALQGSTNYSDRIVRRRTGKPVIIFAAPIRGRADPGRVVGVVVAHYRWAAAQAILDQVDATAQVHLLDRDRLIIGRRSDDRHTAERMPDLALAAGQEGGLAGYAIAERSSHGDATALVVELPQAGVHEYQGSGWRLVLERPADSVFAPIGDMARDTALLVATALLALAGLYTIIGRRFLSPLAALVGGVRRVARGQLDTRVAVAGGDELAELAADFNTMVDHLQERTRQLLAAQDELVKREQLALLGQVAGSVGHELRNPLGVMSNAVFYLQAVHADGDAPTREYLAIIADEIARAERIVADLLDAVRTRAPQAEAVAVAELVDQALGQCAIPAPVTVTRSLSATLPPLRVDPRQVRQALGNLIANAVDAMPDGGTLTITASADPGARTVSLAVRDSGAGIAPEHRARLFQPLFTTKARGIGLGLVVARNLIQANGGRIEADSPPGRGAVFTVTLPAAGAAP